MSRNDGYDEWRRQEASNLRRRIEKRFKALQNPPNCRTAKFLKCYPYTLPQGWGEKLF